MKKRPDHLLELSFATALAVLALAADEPSRVANGEGTTIEQTCAADAGTPDDAAPAGGETGSLEERSAQGSMEVFCRDTQTAIDFYEQIGFTVERRIGTFAALRRGDIWFFLNESPEAPLGSRGVDLRIIAANVDELNARFKALGLPFDTELSDRYYGMREFSLDDPCGIIVRFATPI